MGDLQSWLEQHGGYVHPDLNLFSELPNGDRGVRAVKAIREGDQLLLVPKSLCIYVREREGQPQPDSPLLDLVRSLRLNPFLSTVLLLMAAKASGDLKYKPYISSLPQSHDCLLGWSAKQWALLQGTDLEDRKESAASVFERQVAPLLRDHPATWPPAACGAAAFEWACGMVQSRAFHLVKENFITLQTSEGTDLYLIPAIDMVNHSTRPERRSTALKLVDAPLTVRCGDPPREVTLDGYFTMVAARDIAAGEEVLHTYGDLSDAQLLQTYGFVESWGPGEENPHNVAFLPSAALVEACEAIGRAVGLDGGGGGSGGGGKRRRRGKAAAGEEEGSGGAAGGAARRAVLERLGLLPPNVVVVPAERPLSDELLTVAQVMLMPEQDFLEYAQEFKAEQQQQQQQPGSCGGGGGGGRGDSGAGEGSSPGEQVVRGVLGRAYLDDPGFREAVCFAVLKAVQGCLKRYSTTVAEDEALLAEHAAAVQQQPEQQQQQEEAAAGAASGRESGGAAGLGWRGACAVRVRLGEKRVLERLKREVLALLAEGEGSEGSDGEEEEGSEGSDSELSGDGSEGASGSDEEEEDSGSKASESSQRGEKMDRACGSKQEQQ